MFRSLLCLIVLAFVPSARSAFIDKTDELELALSTRGAVAWVDFNNDGWVDLFGALLAQNNQGKGFTNIRHSGHAAVFGDYDNDGFLDGFGVSGEARSGQLLRNTSGSSTELEPGSWTFERQPFPELPLDSFMSQVWADFNGDSYLDLYLGGARNDRDAVCMSNAGKSFTVQPISDRLYTRGVAACDYDEDHDMDVYTARYWFQANHLYQNDGAGNLADVCGTAGVCGSGHTISCAWGDLDNDGHFDIFACNFNHHDNRRSEDAMLYKNLGAAGDWKFKTMGSFGGDMWQESYGSCALSDYDNDGDMDIFITTVYKGDHARLFRNDGDWNFVNVTDAEGLGGIGTSSNYQAAWGDYDNDGDVDLVTNARLFVNQGNDNHWLRVRLTGNGHSTNRAAIGAQARITVPGLGTLARQVEGGTGQCNQNDLTIHFGLGSHDADVELNVVWPDGSKQTVSTALDRLVTIRQE